MRKILAFLCILATVLCCFTACNEPEPEPPTDAELVEQRIEAFLSAYNGGDMTGAMNCLTAKNRNAMQALLNIMGGVAGNLTGVQIDLRDLFSLGIAMEAEDYMKLEMKEINVLDRANAVASAKMELANAGADTVYFIMKYENNGWFIADMTEIKPSSIGGTSGGTSGGTEDPLKDIDMTFLERTSPSEGLSFTLSDDGTYYILDGIGTCTDTHIVVPEYPVDYNPIPVKKITYDFRHADYVTIPKSITEIYAPSSSLKALHHTGTLEDFLGISIYSIGLTCWGDTFIFVNKTALIGSLVVPSQVQSIGNYLFKSYPHITELTVCGNTRIGEGAFQKCENLSKVTLQSSDGNIGYSAFSNCINLTELNLSSFTGGIGEWAFSFCEKLSGFSLNDNIAYLGEYAFHKTAYVENSANWSKGLLYIGNWLYLAKEDLLTAEVKEGAVGIASHAFYRGHLTQLILPSSLKHIGDHAFYDCFSLHSAKYKGGVSQWHSISIDIGNEPLFQVIEDKTGFPLSTKVLFFNGHTYAVLSGNYTWEDANAYCESIGGHLATLTTDDENAAVHSFVASQRVNVYFGLSKVENGVWKWVTGEEFDYSNWSEECNPEKNAEQYARFWAFSYPIWYAAEGRYSDWMGTNTVFFICEWDTLL